MVCYFRFRNKSISTRFGLLSLSIFLLVLILIIPVSGSIQVYSNPPNQVKSVEIKLDSIEETIDTSPEITKPIVQISGKVVINVTLAAHINVNLTVESDWNASVEPKDFSVNVGPGTRETLITVTIIAPLGIENGTEEIVSVAGTWNYFEGLPGGNISPVFITLTANNSSAYQPDNGNGNGKDKDGNGEDKGFLIGFESIFMISAIIVVVLILFFQKKKKL